MNRKTNHVIQAAHSGAQLGAMLLAPILLLISVAVQLWPITLAAIILLKCH